MTDRVLCPLRDDRVDPTDWVCYMTAGHDGRCRPTLSEEAKDFILNDPDEPWLNRALFDLANVFRIPVTNNGVSWIDADGEPVYDAGDFIEMMRAVIKEFGREVLEPHSLQWHPISAQEMLAGKSAGGSASCTCGNWRVSYFDNMLGKSETRREFLDHVNGEQR